MSTKAIRKLIHQARMGITTHRTCREALAEVEGIEKAAREWFAAESSRRYSMSHASEATLERIAKETK